VNRLILLLLLSLTALAAGGCAGNYYNVPRETYEQKVRVLGVAPVLLDADSDVRHPEKEALFAVIREASRKNEQEMVSLLKDSGGYFAVRLLDENPDLLQARLVSRRERRDDAGVVYNKYFYKPEEIKSLVERQNVDAVMLITVSGLTKNEKVYSSNLLSYLEHEYNYLTMTAQIVDKEGALLWEYPNFRQKLRSSDPVLLPLQFPDFDEARANVTEDVQVKFKTLAGLTRAFAKGENSSLQKGKVVGVLFNRQFEAMMALLQPDRNLFGTKKEEEKKPAAEPVKGEPAK